MKPLTDKARIAWIKANPLRIVVIDAKRNLKRRPHLPQEFEIDYEYMKQFDVDICPLLGIPMEWNTGKSAGTGTLVRAKHNSKSIDRIDTNKGYIRGNVHIVSYRANSIKSDATLEELITLTDNLKKLTTQDETIN